MDVGMINVPAKVGAKNWRKCWHLMAKESDVFGVNEALYKPQKLVYSLIARKRGWGCSGLWNSPNPIFWDKKKYRKVDRKIVKLHGRGANYVNYPGFNGERYANVVVLRRRDTGEKAAVINTHLAAYNGQKVATTWVNEQHKISMVKIQNLIRDYVGAGVKTWLLGDMNTKEALSFDLLPRFRFFAFKAVGIDKVYVFLPKLYKTEFSHNLREVPAPTDHKYGNVATLEED